MDLYAYTQIENLDAVAKANGINIPRLRGYRLMGNETRSNEGDVEELLREYEMEVYESACTSSFAINPTVWAYCGRTRRVEEKYLIKRVDEKGREQTVGFRWDRLHGKRRKNLKYSLKNKKRRVLEQVDTFNKYVGRKDVLYIHARIGGGNWLYYGGTEIERQPWFLEKVDDCWDSTYCDIYAKIDPATLKMALAKEGEQDDN